MLTPQDALVRKLSNFAPLAEDELAVLNDLQSKHMNIDKAVDLIHEGQRDHSAYILKGGWAFCYKMVPDGGRQIVTFLMPGDFVGMRSLLLRVSDHSVATFTDCLVSRVTVKQLSDAFHNYPRLGMAILWAISRDEAVVVEHLVNIGRRSAIERTAHFFLELGKRLQLVGLSSSSDFEFPFNQYLLADALGLSAIHVNRVLRELRELGLITIREHRVAITDLLGLTSLAGFDSDYLDDKPLI